MIEGITVEHAIGPGGGHTALRRNDGVPLTAVSVEMWSETGRQFERLAEILFPNLEIYVGQPRHQDGWLVWSYELRPKG